MLKSRKNFFFFKFKLVFLNYKYLFFVKNNLLKKKNTVNSISLKSKDLMYFFIDKNILNFFNFNSDVYFFNNYLDFLILQINLSDILFVSYSGFFLNNSYNKNITNYYLYYSNNYKLYTYSIYKPSSIWRLIICVYYYKLLKLLITLQQNKKNFL